MAILAANWKMNGSLGLIRAFAEVRTSLAGSSHEILFFPPFPLMQPLQQALADMSRLQVGAQNVSQFESGAYTGEVSAAMLAEQGLSHVLVGHSERRLYFGETNEIVAEKALRAQAHGLVPIVCIGESLAERESGQTFSVLSAQIQALAEAGVQLHEGLLLLAYEPIWAIGTGLAASPEDITAVHRHIHQCLAELTDATDSQVSILYGGSVNAGNLAAILAAPHVAGALIGGASLKVDEFQRMAAL